MEIEWDGETTRAALPGRWRGKLVAMKRVAPGVALVWRRVVSPITGELEWTAEEGARRIGWPRVRGALDVAASGWIAGVLVRQGGYSLLPPGTEDWRAVSELIETLSAWASPVIESKLPVLSGQVLSSGGGEVRLVVDRTTTDYPAVNERVIITRRSRVGSLAR